MPETDNNLLHRMFQAYYDARKNKRNTHSQLRFEIEHEARLVALYHAVRERRYQIRPSITFIVKEPLQREVFAADFTDRVIHHLLFNLINPVFDALFIPESFSCRTGKGTHCGIHTLNNAIIACSNHYRRDCYILKLDIRGYFMNIDKTILKQILYRGISDSSLINENDKDLARYLVKTILDDDPTRHCRIKGYPIDWKGLPRSKSLFHSPENCGLPIGNLTSQLFSNVYLNGFDHYVKSIPGVIHYGRYVDDFYVVHEDRFFLRDLIPVFKTRLKKFLHLDLHPGKVYLQHYTKGVNFLGATIKPYRMYVANRTKRKFNHCIRSWEIFLDTSTPAKSELHRMRASINSYLGILQHYRAYGIKKKALLDGKNKMFCKYGYLKNVKYTYMTYCLNQPYR
jgi:retron-type reverse transcriptase